jgi:SAM-dependent methyltransferase
MRLFFAFLVLFHANLAFSENILPNASVFSDIYERGEWGVNENKKGNSGSGSDPRNAMTYIAFLQNFLAQNNIKSVVDLGCGDWRLGREIRWGGVQYIGIDVVESVIHQNIENFSSPKISFIVADGVDYSLPKADLLICKDVLQHLPFEDIKCIVKQFNKFKFCIIVNDVDPVKLTCENLDIPRGHYRCLDLTKPPFSISGRKMLTYASGEETKQLLLIKN